AGSGGSAAAARGSAGAARASASWGAAIAAQIERHKRYPRDARGATGKVSVALTIGRDGSLRGVRLRRSSGSVALDAAALAAVRAAAPYPPAPAALGDASYSFSLTVAFRR
ncbi:TonB family protein, partial [Acidimangrovimonas pyrenivorans]